MKDKISNPKQSSLHYGLTSLSTALFLAQRVCDVLGHGRNQGAVAMLLETACAETDLGHFKDPTPLSAGWGLTQGDAIAVYDVAARTRQRDCDLLNVRFNFDMRSLKPEDLAHNPLKAFIFTRAFYKLIPEPFPTSIPARAGYWKHYYNTKLGKGTVDKYVQKAHRYLYSSNGLLHVNTMSMDTNKTEKQ